ncbi:MAG: hypothetical protein LBH88_03070 [Candidatus Methanoplasma sp.]|jgi:hypothetical protein|nr:hypothetical protein [Candidatus Methanoplasma sp.]
MQLKNRKGLTAMVDAMIFIVVIGLAVSAFFAFSGDESAPNDASAISDSIFSAKVRINDTVDTQETGLVSLPDMAAFHIMTGDGSVMDYIESIMESLMQRPDSYSLSIEYSDNTVTIGRDKGDAVSGSVKEYTVTYGGSIRVDLRLY